MKKFIKIILFLIVVLLVAYFVVLNLPKSSVKNKDADFKLSATELYNAFEANEKKSNKLYIGKTVEVKGKFLTQNKDNQGATVVIMDGGGSLGGVLCTLEQGQESKLSEIKQGDEITIKGMCTGLLMDVVLNKCVIQ
ncbi:MAG: hypothetical protein HKN67_09505 [Saprospiraceae bacterium]|nr:OB-fold putative lipoprotein [Bacteroidia bacterium]MBT8228943.1 OB-fold putative lipoprotein [Bacteroidia bacterium]NNF22167.1 hypothetical protein [Saprospiraceae bacterium]NNK90460.1 hypothetical protein [Saprospiraceae bacterium]